MGVRSLVACASFAAIAVVLMSSSSTVAAAPLAHGVLTWTPLGPEEGTPVRFALPDSLLAGAMSITWSFGDGTASSDPAPLHTFPDVGAYAVRADLVLQDGSSLALTDVVGVVNRACGDSWRRVHASPAPVQIRDVAFTPTGTPGYAIGDDGALLRFDSIRWSPLAGAPKEDFVAIAAPATNAIFAASGSGAIAKFDGASWSTMLAPALEIRDVAAASPTVAFAGGETLLKLASSTWTPVALAGLSGSISAIDLASTASGALVTSDGQLWRFDGSGWQLLATAPEALVSVEVVTPTRFVAAAAERVWTWNGAWSAVELPGASLTRLAIASAADGWAVGSALYRLDASGWGIVPSIAGSDAFTAVGLRGSDAWLFGPGMIVRHRAGGFDLVSVVADKIAALDHDGRIAWGGDARGRLFSDDGAGWVYRADLGGAAVTGIAFADGAARAVDEAGAIWRREGDSWIVEHAASAPLRAVAFSGGAWWAAGDDGIILTRADGAWSRVVAPTTADLRALAFAGPSAGVAVGDVGAVLRWNGLSWLSVPGATVPLHGATMLSTSDGWVVGDSRIYRLGPNGLAPPVAIGASFRDVAARGNEIWAFGTGGVMWRSTGGPWSYAGTAGADIIAADFADATLGALTGELGLFHRFEAVPCAAPAFEVPAVIVEGEPAVFEDLSGVTPPDTIASRTWDFGDGTTSALAQPTHVFAQNGVRTVRLTVRDDDGGIATASRVVTILDVSPVASMPSVPALMEGAPFTFDASGSRAANAADPLTRLEWDFDHDGTFDVDALGPTPTWSYAEQGARPNVLRVWDEDSFAPLAFVVEVLDHAPTAIVPPEISIVGCANLTLDANASTDVWADTIGAYEWDVEYDGSFRADAFGEVVEVDCPRIGDTPIALRVRDEDGSESLATLVAHASNPIEIDPPGTREADDGSTVALDYVVGNLGELPILLGVNASIDQTWRIVTQPNVTIDGGGQAILTVLVDVPPDARGGVHANVSLHLDLALCGFNITTGDGDGGVSVRRRHAIDLSVVGPSGQDLDLRSGAQGARYDVRVSNVGNIPALVDLAPLTASGWRASVDASMLELAVAASTIVHLEVLHPLADGASEIANVTLEGSIRDAPTVRDAVSTSTRYHFTYDLAPRMNEISPMFPQAGLERASTLAAAIETATGIDVKQASIWDAPSQSYRSWSPGSPSFADFAIADAAAVRVWLRPDDPDWAGRASATWMIRGLPRPVVDAALAAGESEIGWTSVAPGSASGLAAAIGADAGVPVREVWRWDAAGQHWRAWLAGAPEINDFALVPGEGYHLVFAEGAPGAFSYTTFGGYGAPPASAPEASARSAWRSPAWDLLRLDSILAPRGEEE